MPLSNSFTIHVCTGFLRGSEWQYTPNGGSHYGLLWTWWTGSYLFPFPFVDLLPQHTGSCSSHCIGDKSKTPQPVFTYNDFYSPPDIKMTLPSTAYTSPPVSSLSTLLDLKHHRHQPYIYNTFPDKHELNDNIINNNIPITDIPYDDSQPSIFFTTNPIDNLMMILLRNSCLILKQKRPRMMLRIP